MPPNCLRLLSGRSHRVYTGICLITPKGKLRQELIETRVRFKRLSREELESYLASGEWRGKAGGYAVQGLAGALSSSWLAPTAMSSVCRSMRPSGFWLARASRFTQMAVPHQLA